MSQLAVYPRNQSELFCSQTPGGIQVAGCDIRLSIQSVQAGSRLSDGSIRGTTGLALSVQLFVDCLNLSQETAMLTMLTVCLLVQEKIKGHGAAPPPAHPAPSRNRLAALSQPSHTYLSETQHPSVSEEDLCSP